ncbi:MAG: hypothetical protein IPH11_06785 [Ignavibacteriales bacterium]|nr:hypothetical protein [Ignavibacteriales bacterium]
MALLNKIFPVPVGIINEKKFESIDFKKLLLLFIELSLLLFVISKFKVEEEHGIILALVPIGIGFLIHSILPLQYKLPFFLLLSFITYGIVIGALNAFIIFLLGSLFILIANLRLNYWLKVSIIFLGFALLLLVRTGVIQTEWGASIVPIFGSIFMFRMVLYLYEMKQRPIEANIWQHLSYFFLLPNVLFPLFPIVDYKTYLRTYYDSSADNIYQKGIQWMVRGVIQLLLFKFVYYYITQTIATVITLLIVFFITWMLHSYQWLWIQGIFPITLVDGLFWGIFGILIVINSVIQEKKKKKKSLGKKVWTFSDALKLSAQITGMFIFMNILWSLWMSSSVAEWIETMSMLQGVSISELSVLVGAIILLILIGAIIQFPINKYLASGFSKNKTFNKSVLISGLTILLLFLIGIQEYYLPKKNRLGRVVSIISSNKPNAKDAEVAERGYYEPILKGNVLTTELAENEAAVPPDWKPLYESEAVKETGDLYFIELLPSKSTIFKKSKSCY